MEPRWLDDSEMRTWRALHLVMSVLPGRLGGQLQGDSELGFLEYYVLAALSEQTGGTMRISELAVLANSELSRMSHLIRRMEAKGTVRRETDPTDGRYTNAILTPQGRDAVVAAAPGHVAKVRELIFDVLTDEEQRQLGDALSKVVTQLLGATC